MTIALRGLVLSMGLVGVDEIGKLGPMKIFKDGVSEPKPSGMVIFGLQKL